MFFFRRFTSTIVLASVLLVPVSPQTSSNPPTQQPQKPQPKCTNNGTRLLKQPSGPLSFY